MLAVAAPPAMAQNAPQSDSPASEPLTTSSLPNGQRNSADSAAPASGSNAESQPSTKPTATPPSEAAPPAAAAPDTPASSVAPVERAAPPAGEQPAVATPAPEAAPAAPPPLNAALLAAIERTRPAARQTQDREWHDAIGAFYAAREGLPVWMNERGPSAAAEALVAEIARADEWGLDPKEFDVSDIPQGASSPDALAAAELKIARALLTYAWHARGGRVDPSQLSKWLDQSPRPLNVGALLADFATVTDVSVALQKLHPQHRGFELLRQAYLKSRGATPERERDTDRENPRALFIPDGPTLEVGDRHPHVEQVRRRLDLPTDGPDADLYDEEVAAAVREFLGPTYRDRRGRRVERPEHPPLTNYVRETLSRKQREAAKAAKSDGPTRKQFLVNLERWRWLPENLGNTYVWNNLPEYTTRVMQNGKVVHQERIIIGKPETQTPVFSDEMQFVVFHPDWGVPSTIKVQDLLPSLQHGDDSILRRRNMRIVSGSRTVHPSDIDWSRTDIRKVSIVQDPGPSNPLGQLKFMFPNKHDVYMHDTPTKNLFDSSTRAYSFGCIRVRNPVRLAEVVFGHDRNWTKTDVTDLLQRRAPQNNRVDLNRRIPVHNTYFTLLADESGNVSSFADVYGHDKRIQAALLDGERVDVVARSDPALALERKVKKLAASPPPPRDGYGGWNDGGWSNWGWGPPPSRRGRGGGNNDFFSGLFGN